MADRPVRGVRAPDFVLPTDDGAPTRFYGAAGGRPTVLSFTGGTIEVDGAGDERLVFVDDAGEVRDRFGVEPGTALVLDANLRVLGTAAVGDAAAVRAVVESADAPGPDVQVHAQAPVLLIPHVLDPSACAWLRQLWADGGAEETGVETTTEVTRAEVRNVKQKRRRDLVITDQHTTQQIAQAVGRAVMPEVRRAFAYRATRFEGFKIGCYDEGSAGFFSAHRDNLSPQTAHRRFALSLNLDDDYEGGEVRFPEYGPQRYRPPAGGALVFSGSLLHEVVPVTRGRRFVLLSFLYGEDAVRRA